MSSSTTFANIFALPIISLQYHDIATGIASDARGADGDVRNEERAEVEMSQADLAARIRKEREEAASLVEQKLRQDYEQKTAAARSAIATAISAFEREREEYFAGVESEVVQLALSIAAKILHREAQVDTLLVAGIVRVAIEKLHDKTDIKLRVGVGTGAKWKQYCESHASLAQVEVLEDPKLSSLDCLLETHLGTANLGLDGQLKEVEKGFFDLMALRPAKR
ncbi:MAG TPA: FliH/SctL family protein [Terracidiphilus sp.]